MAARFRLSSLLRARLAQEDAAKAEVARARGAVRAAGRTVADARTALQASDLPSGGTGLAVVAAIAARHSLAAGLAAARQGVVSAEEQADERVAELAEAAKRRRAVEKLAERHAAARKFAEQAADQRVVDELAITAASRREEAE